MAYYCKSCKKYLSRYYALTCNSCGSTEKYCGTCRRCQWCGPQGYREEENEDVEYW
ncbi:Histidine-rich_calcium-binding [Hexamita inflata]|uniref:Histidine-rich calcium-binding n=1 Tax=Hexamita inflata TaxID=28002 RepID=A0AA86Q9Q5_9EUKA|nr:Histidine-rich calcium-binding [Hexamita inflata]